MPDQTEIKPLIDLNKIDSKETARQAVEQLRKALRHHNYRYYVLDNPVVSEEFKTALWALVDVVEAEVAGPLKPKPRQIMIESLQRISALLAEG